MTRAAAEAAVRFVLAATGFRREAALIAAPGVRTVVSGGDGAALRARLDEAAAGATAVVSVGIGGGLSAAAPVSRWVLADSIVGEGGTLAVDAALSGRLRVALRSAGFDVTVGPIASGDVIVASAADKAALHASTGALAVDMESRTAAAFATGRGLPFAALRVISDAADHALPPAVMVSMRADGGLDLPAILWSLAKRPGQLPALVRTGREAERAFRTLGLLGRHHLLGRLGIGDPDLGQLTLDVV